MSLIWSEISEHHSSVHWLITKYNGLFSICQPGKINVVTELQLLSDFNFAFLYKLWIIKLLVEIVSQDIAVYFSSSKL